MRSGCRKEHGELKVYVRGELWLFFQLLCTSMDFGVQATKPSPKTKVPLAQELSLELLEVCPSGRRCHFVILSLSCPGARDWCLSPVFLTLNVEHGCAAGWHLSLCLALSVCLSNFQKCYEWVSRKLSKRKIICHNWQEVESTGAASHKKP